MTTSIPLFTTIRLLSLVIVVTCAYVMPDTLFKSLFTATLFGHYALSFYYAKTQAKKLTTMKVTWIPLAVLTAATVAYIVSGAYVWFLAGFIGLHIALSEVYMVNLGQEPPPDARWHLNLSRYVTNAFIYLLLLHQVPLFKNIPLALSFAGIAVGFIYFVVAMKRYGAVLTPNARRDFMLFEVSGIVVGLILFGLNVPMSPPMFVYYHITTWILYPAASFHLRGDKPAMKKFLVQTAAITALFFVISNPIWLAEHSIDLVAAIPLWATLHFATSFPLSRLNPTFITRHFYPR